MELETTGHVIVSLLDNKRNFKGLKEGKKRLKTNNLAALYQSSCWTRWRFLRNPKCSSEMHMHPSVELKILWSNMPTKVCVFLCVGAPPTHDHSHSHERAFIVSVTHRYLLTSLQHISGLLSSCREVLRQVHQWRKTLSNPSAHGPWDFCPSSFHPQRYMQIWMAWGEGGNDTEPHELYCNASSEGGTASLPSCLPELLLASTVSLFATSGVGEVGTSSTSLEEKQRLCQVQRWEGRGQWSWSSSDDVDYSHRNVLYTFLDQDRAVPTCLHGQSYNPWSS